MREVDQPGRIFVQKKQLPEILKNYTIPEMKWNE